MLIYVCGSIYGGTQKIDTYKSMISELEKNGVVLNKQIADLNTIANEFFRNDEDIYNDLEEKLKKSRYSFCWG